MKYFRIRQDYRDQPMILIKKIPQLPNSNKILLGEVGLLPKSMSFPVESKAANQYSDVLSEQIFMVKESVFTLLKLFHNDLEYRTVFLSDLKYDEIHFYYVPILPLENCLSEKSDCNLDKSVVKNVVIKKSNDYPDIFRIGNIKDKIVIVSLALAEAILRRSPVGICLEKVEIDDGVAI